MLVLSKLNFPYPFVKILCACVSVNHLLDAILSDNNIRALVEACYRVQFPKVSNPLVSSRSSALKLVTTHHMQKYHSRLVSQFYYHGYYFEIL